MKTMAVIICLFTLITTQAATISQKSSSAIETKIELQRQELNEKTSYPVGNKRVVAVSVFQIEAILEKSESMLSDLKSETNLSEKEIAEKILDINYFLVVSENLIYQLPY